MDDKRAASEELIVCGTSRDFAITVSTPQPAPPDATWMHIDADSASEHASQKDSVLNSVVCGYSTHTTPYTPKRCAA